MTHPSAQQQWPKADHGRLPRRTGCLRLPRRTWEEAPALPDDEACERLEGGGAYGEAVGMAYAGVAVAPSSSALANEKRGRSVAEPPTVCP